MASFKEKKLRAKFKNSYMIINYFTIVLPQF